MVKLLYFARLREALGVHEEEIELAAGFTVAQLTAYLASRGEPWRTEFGGSRPLRAAVNRTLTLDSMVIEAGDEVAFFPPVTGG